MEKILSIVVIALFLGMTIAPSINANVEKESELVEITTDICGLKGGKNTIKLTKEEADEVDRLFANIRQRLNESTSREEGEEIFKEAVVELDTYGLLGGLSVKQAQRLVTGEQNDLRTIKPIEEVYRKVRRTTNSNEDMLCLIFGETNETYIEGQVALFVERFLGQFWVLYIIFRGIVIKWLEKNPISLVNRINLGYVDDEFEVKAKYYYSHGWITSVGMSGLKSYDGILKGDLPLKGTTYMSGPITLREYYPAVASFTGLKLFKSDVEETKYIGFALWVKIEELN
jgi:hypothetical protein